MRCEATPDRLDIRRFPRVIPEYMTLVDAFPLNPLPEQLDPSAADLFDELALADAPFSGRHVACILAGSDEGYGGHTVERNSTDVDDPFLMALRKVPDGARLYGIMVTGRGPMKEKHVMPSGAAYDLIMPLLLPGAPIVVIPPGSKDMCRFIPEPIHRAAYAPKAASVFRGKTFFESQIEAIRYTNLNMEDCELAAHLRLSGLLDGIHYYLTGSSHGPSGPSYACRPGMYGDLDIIAVSHRPKEEVEACFENIVEAHYGSLAKEPKVVHIAGSEDALEGCVYANTQAGICIDFYATHGLKSAFVRPEYLSRNFYHQLS